MSEPGVTLGRLVAAERNAATSLEWAKRNQAAAEKMVATVGRLERAVMQLQQENASLRQLLISRVGPGPTASNGL